MLLYNSYYSMVSPNLTLGKKLKLVENPQKNLLLDGKIMEEFYIVRKNTETFGETSCWGMNLYSRSDIGV